MSVMMAASTVGPVPVAQHTNNNVNPANITMRSGHTRQSSRSGGGAASNSATFGQKHSRSTQLAAAAGAPTTGGFLGENTTRDNDGDPKTSPRTAGLSSGPQGRAAPPPLRVSVPAASTQRPSTSHETHATTGLPTAQRQPHRSTTTRQADQAPQPASQAPPPTTPLTTNPPLNPSSASRTNHNQQLQSGSQSSSFPHAFERWEMLSSRWEGLTGYWVSRLEQNRQELSPLPLEQEMSRQITDLAAAGANLFQALIELQRLRASSERKFQRWFFETRADQERAREMSSELERSLRVERQHRADAVAQIKRLQNEKTKAETMVEETHRELQISRDECRRAWEELGRREQEERDITTSLRDGHPALVGGFQVTPMPMPGVPTRSNSNATRPKTSAGPPSQAVAQDTFPTSQQHRQTTPTRQSQPHEGDLLDLQEAQQLSTPTGAATARSTTAADSPSPNYAPLLPQQHPQHSERSPHGGFYQQDPVLIHGSGRDNPPPANMSPVSYATHPNIGSPTLSGVSDVSRAFLRDEHGNVIQDERGNPRYVDELESREGDEWGGGYSSGGSNNGGGGGNGDNGGGGVGGVGIGPGWEGVPRHHHPTRLSDVLEEDERMTASDGRRSGMG